ncbi:MAG: ATP-binding protein, partial [Deltaproteobacteria bacterium]|nr:ATP-binding protein [Deltaproteobacteria bacterium]
MLTKLDIDNYRHFSKCSIPFGSVQLICGRNGTGKTAIVELLARLRYFLLGYNEAFSNPCSVNDLCSAADLPRWKRGRNKKHMTAIGFAFTTLASDVFEYAVEIEHSCDNTQTSVSSERLTYNGSTIYEKDFEPATRAENGAAIAFPLELKFSGLRDARRNSEEIQTFFSDVVVKLIPLSLNPRGFSGNHSEKSMILSLSGSNFSAWYD